MAAPAKPEDYLPEVHGFKDAKVDIADPRYISARKAAHAAGLDQSQFSQMLGFEASRVMGQSKTAPATPVAAGTPAAPAAPRKIENYANLSFAEKLAAAGHI